MTNQTAGEVVAQILTDLGNETSTNAKLSILTKHSDNALLREVLQMTYDKSVWTFGVQRKTLEKIAISVRETAPKYDLAEGLQILRTEFATGDVTGNRAVERLSELLNGLSASDRQVLSRVLVRDQRIGMGKTQINKVWKNCITKPAYMRCSVLTPSTLKKAKFPAIVQKKADGTYREFRVEDSEVTCMSRSGETYEHPLQFKILKDFPDGVYVGELTVRGITDRKDGNAQINSKNPPHDDIILELWDYVTLQEYATAMQGSKGNAKGTAYKKRFETLSDIIKNSPSDAVQLIETEFVDSLADAIEVTAKWMASGYEGSVLKNMSGVFKNGTSTDQFKIKLEIEADVRCIGFKDGTPGTKREGKVGSMLFANDEGTIRGSCSGFSDELLDEMTQTPEKFIGRVFEVQFNDLVQAVNHDFWSLSHPRFVEFRDDKDTTDTLERVRETRAMAAMQGGKAS